MSRIRMTPLDPLPLNSGMPLVFTSATALTGLSQLVVIDITPASGTVVRVELDESDCTLSGGDLVATYSQSSAWVAANLVAGTVRGHWFVSGVIEDGFTFEVYTPDGGEINP